MRRAVLGPHARPAARLLALLLMAWRDRPSHRQVRLMAWLNDPRGDDLPDIAKHGFNWRHACWSAAEIVHHSGIYVGGQARDACLSDLRRLVRLGKVTRVDSERNTRWMIPWDGCCLPPHHLPEPRQGDVAGSRS